LNLVFKTIYYFNQRWHKIFALLNFICMYIFNIILVPFPLPMLALIYYLFLIHMTSWILTTMAKPCKTFQQICVQLNNNSCHFNSLILVGNLAAKKKRHICILVISLMFLLLKSVFSHAILAVQNIFIYSKCLWNGRRLIVVNRGWSPVTIYILKSNNFTSKWEQT